MNAAWNPAEWRGEEGFAATLRLRVDTVSQQNSRIAPPKPPTTFRPQNMNFTENCNCRGLNAVRGSPKLEFGVVGINRVVPIGVGATDPPGTEIPPFGHVTDAAC